MVVVHLSVVVFFHDLGYVEVAVRVLVESIALNRRLSEELLLFERRNVLNSASPQPKLVRGRQARILSLGPVEPRVTRVDPWQDLLVQAL